MSAERSTRFRVCFDDGVAFHESRGRTNFPWLLRALTGAWDEQRRYRRRSRAADEERGWQYDTAVTTDPPAQLGPRSRASNISPGLRAPITRYVQGDEVVEETEVADAESAMR